MDEAVDFVAVLVLAVVPGGSEDQDAGVAQAAASAAERVVLVSLDRRHSEAHVDDPNMISPRVLRDPLKPRHCSFERALPMRVEHANIQQRSAGRNAEIGVTGSGVTGGGSRHMCGLCGWGRRPGPTFEVN